MVHVCQAWGVMSASMVHGTWTICVAFVHHVSYIRRNAIRNRGFSGPPRSGAGVGVAMLRGAGDSLA